LEINIRDGAKFTGSRESAFELFKEVLYLSLASDERMSWAAGRVTKREEDAAYLLLGLFDVYMPLIYGEGRENAFIRLRKRFEKVSKG